MVVTFPRDKDDLCKPWRSSTLMDFCSVTALRLMIYGLEYQHDLNPLLEQLIICHYFLSFFESLFYCQIASQSFI